MKRVVYDYVTWFADDAVRRMHQDIISHDGNGAASKVKEGAGAFSPVTYVKRAVGEKMVEAAKKVTDL